MEELTCTIEGLDKTEDGEAALLVAKLMDAAREKNLNIGPPLPTNYYEMQMQALSSRSANGVVAFRPANMEGLLREARINAIRNAKAAAAMLAEQADVKLGGIIAIDMMPADQKSMTPWGMMSGDQAEKYTGTIARCTVKVNVRVTFAVE